jgi:hypothetical protein
LTGFVIGVLIVVAFIGAAVIVGIRQGRANVRQGVIAAWEGLRVTQTELIEGYKANARRHPLKGLTARVEDTGTRVHLGGGRDDRRIHVIVEGPNTAIVKAQRVAAMYNGDAAARKFAAALNMASRQLTQN